MVELFGIKNCDKVRASRKWLDTANIDYQFRDVRENPISINQWEIWLKFFGWEKLINRRSTSWKQLSESAKISIDNDNAIALLVELPTLMKRPLLSISSNPVCVGFTPQNYADIFKS